MRATLKQLSAGRSLTVAALLSIHSIAWSQVNVLQNRNDLGATGANLKEVTLTGSNVSINSFGRLFSYPVDGEVVAQPLYVSKVSIQGQGTHNTLYVATMRNAVYAFDANGVTSGVGGKLWSVDLNQTAGNGATPFKTTDVTGRHSENFPVGIGILSTPVIDLLSSTMYVVAATKENGAKIMRLHALDIRSGDERLGSPVEIRGDYPMGSGALTFNPEAQSQRAALVISGQNLILTFSSHDDAIPFQGWVMAYDKVSFQLTGTFATVTAGGVYGGGIWQVGRPPVVDPDRGLIYVFTGNALGGTGYDGVHNFSESVLCLDSGHGLQLVDWFTPGNWSTLDARDSDLAASGPMLIPGTSLLTGGGKEGVLYILDTANLGKFVADDSQIVQKQKIVANGRIMGGPVFWNRPASAGGPLLYHSGGNDVLRAYSFDGQHISADAVATSAESNAGQPGGVLSLSANGTKAGTGIVWSYARAQTIPGGFGLWDIMPGILRAYDAGNVSRLLWTNQMNPRRDDAGLFGKFVVPTVANGKVYLGTWSNQVVVYGRLPTNADFRLTVTPARNVALAGLADYRVDMIPLNNYNETITWGVQGLPAGANASFLGPNPDGSMTLHLQLPDNTAAGVYTLNVIATGTSKTHAQPALLMVSDAVSIPREGWSIAYVDSEEPTTNNAATKAIDGDPATLWETQFVTASPGQPHELRIDLGAVYNVSGFSYLPRQDNSANGKIRKFEAYVSLDGTTWGPTVYDGSFDYSNGLAIQRQFVLLPSPKPGRFFRLRSLFEVNFQPWTSVAEIDVFSTSQPALPTNVAERIIAMKGTDNTGWIKTNVAGNWAAWFSLAGQQVLDDPVVVSPANTNWVLFARGTDRAVWTQTNTGSGWSGWVSLGGIVVSRPAAVVSGNSRIDLLGQGTNQAIWTRSRVNGSWSTWTSLGGCTSPASAPTAVTAGTGLVYAFVRGCDNAVWVSTLGPSGWSPWSSLGGVANSDVTAVVSTGGQIYLFLIGTNRALYSLTQTSTGAWGPWRSFGGTVIGNYVSPVSLPNGDVQVFVLGTNSAVFSGTIDHATSAWGGWKTVQLYDGNTELSPTFVAPPRAIVDARGEVFLTGLTNTGDLWEIRTVYGQWIVWAPSN